MSKPIEVHDTHSTVLILPEHISAISLLPEQSPWIASMVMVTGCFILTRSRSTA